MTWIVREIGCLTSHATIFSARFLPRPIFILFFWVSTNFVSLFLLSVICNCLMSFLGFWGVIDIYSPANRTKRPKLLNDYIRIFTIYITQSEYRPTAFGTKPNHRVWPFLNDHPCLSRALPDDLWTILFMESEYQYIYKLWSWQPCFILWNSTSNLVRNQATFASIIFFYIEIKYQKLTLNNDDMAEV